MANKTQPTTQSIEDFLSHWVESSVKREESRQLIAYMQRWTGHPPILWGPSIVGFGRYRYTYTSGHSGETPLIGFSPRKSAFSLYVYIPDESTSSWLDSLGKFTQGKTCLYVKKLSDIDLIVLEHLCRATIQVIQTHYEVLL